MQILSRLAAVVATIACAGLALPALAAEAPNLKSSAALIVDEETGEVLYGKNESAVVPIASITKLMTAMVTLDAGLPLEETITVTADDAEAGTAKRRARLPVGASLARAELLQLALMASENRAAAALGRAYPGGMDAFVKAMNAKAHELEMTDSRFVEPTGLSSENVSSAGDLAKLVKAAKGYPLIAEYSTTPNAELTIRGKRVPFVNTNGLVRGGNWEIGLSKTGFINAAGRCLVMQAKVATRSLIIVLLDSVGKYTRIGDAIRIRQWLEPGFTPPVAAVRSPAPRAKQPAAVRSQRASNDRVRIEIQAPKPQ
ncbi:MAG TPA: D-alanyl-D-alanine endopeptidase [Burkholderiales bacterium]|nr:D-alanyl-D-alanine endopeptidase [Burkholderiales bacterium]